MWLVPDYEHRELRLQELELKIENISSRVTMEVIKLRDSIEPNWPSSVTGVYSLDELREVVKQQKTIINLLLKHLDLKFVDKHTEPTEPCLRRIND